MIDNDYLIDIEWSDSGGSCDFLPIKHNPNIGFKSFRNKKKAKEAFENQEKLSKFNLAPKVCSSICKIPYYYDPKILEFWDPKTTTSEWGYITEKACLLEEHDKPYELIQDLVTEIYNQTKLEFWDCHLDNIGYIKRKNKSKLVCIDTGNESFHYSSNAWGFSKPGPKCCYCDEYQCGCSL